jgi:diaminopimelate epimerase
LANRHTGIGFDQLLLLNDSNVPSCDAAYRFFNPDGSEAEQCGNGQRCISQYLYEKNKIKTDFCISGLAGLIYSVVNENGTITINMGSANSIKSVDINNNSCYQVDFGNPHLIHVVQDIYKSNLSELNKLFTKNYSDGINFEIVEVLNVGNIKLRVHERGTGETLACGSGACATVAALQYAKKLNNRVKVTLPGGNLVVEYNRKKNNYYLTGPAIHVFTGEITI